MTWSFRKMVGGFVAVVAAIATTAQAQDSILSQAVTHLSFDEEAGPALDSAKGSQHPDNGTLVGNPARVASPFWNQSGKKALLLNSDQKQLVTFGESPELDRPDAVTVSFYALNLHRLDDAAFHGLFAKRVEPGGSSTNYGINFQPSGDVLQVYFHDTAGYRVAQYSVKATLGSRRMNYLTAVLEVGDAPEPDADTDKDDVRVALFLNGKPLKPGNATPNGRVVENDAWMLDVQVGMWLNDSPLTIGASHASIEHTNMLVDEFSLFAKALTAADVAKLFAEVAGPNAEQLAQQEALPAVPTQPAPVLQRLSQYGLQRGQTTRLALTGQNLSPESAKIVVPGVELNVALQPNSNANQLIANVTVPADAPAGRYPLRVATAGGISSAEGIAIDDLPQRVLNANTPEQPAVLPIALSGNIAGGQTIRVPFEGKAGQRIVADIESRRLGASAEMDPVLELKNAKGTPIKIVWDTPGLGGDVRIDMKLPSDGQYFLELHDLQYKAPGASPFRLKLGDLQLVDAIFPPRVARSAEQVPMQLIGTSVKSVELSQLKPDVELTRQPLLRGDLGFAGPMPLLRVTDSIEITETPAAAGQLQVVDATFAQAKHVPLVINGRIVQRGEADKFVLAVTPGMSLNMVLEAADFGSPLAGQLLVAGHPQGNGLAGGADRPGSRDPGLDFAVPAGVTQIQVHVSDLFGRGGENFLYRLRIVPAGQPSFSLTTSTQSVTVPAGGTALAEVQLTRQGYAGPILLKVVGDDHVKVLPEQLLPTAGNGKYFVTLLHNGDPQSTGPRSVRLLGESLDLVPPLRVIATNSANSKNLVSHQELLPIVVSGSSPLQFAALQPPATLFRGLPAEVALSIQRKADAPGAALPVLLRLESNEEPRKSNPAVPNSPNKPLVAIAPNQMVAAGATTGSLRIVVPLDVAAGMIQFVAKAEIVPHEYSSQVLGQVHSTPFLLPVQNAAAVTLDANTLTLVGGQPNKVLGTIKRTAPFAGAIDVTLQGLPTGYTAPKITVPGDKDAFEITVTAGPEAAAKDIPNITLRVEATGLGMILPDAPVAMKASPSK